jgi:hypothetical protein
MAETISAIVLAEKLSIMSKKRRSKQRFARLYD